MKISANWNLPLLREDIASGFYAPWTHSGFVLTLTWAFVVQGSADEAGVARLINIFYLFAMLAIVFAWSNGVKKAVGTYGSTPSDDISANNK